MKLFDMRAHRAMVVFLFWSVSFLFVFGKPLTVGASFSSRPLSGFVDVYSFPRDDVRKPTPEMILSGKLSGRFTPFTKANLGISDNEHWLRIGFEFVDGIETARSEPLYLEVASSDLDLIECYAPNPDGSYPAAPLREGRSIRGNESAFPLQNAVFPIRPRQGPQTVYLRIVSQDFVKLPIRLVTLRDLLTSTRNEFFMDVLVLGIVFGLFCYNAFLAVSTRSRFYVFYLLYLVSMFMYIMIAEGYARYYLFPPEFFLSTKGSMLFSYCAVAAGAFFAFDIYDTKTRFPKLDFTVRAAVATLALCGLLNTITGKAVFYNIGSMTEALCMVLLIIVIVRAVILLKTTSAWYYAVSWIPMLFVVILYQFQNAGVFQTTTALADFATRQGMNLAVAFQAIMVSLALGDFLNTMKTEKTTALLEKNHAEDMARAKTDYFLELAHEMKTPLTVINGQADRLLAGNEGPLEARVRIPLTAIRRNGASLLRTVTNLLDIGMMEVSALTPRMKSVRIGLLLKGIEQEAYFIARQRRIVLEFDYPENPELITVTADSDLTSQAISNVVTNALKYSPADGRVVVTLHAAERTVLISVDDSGPGLTETDMGRLFNRYQRLENARESGIQGTGIGLHAAKRIMNLQNGDITAAKSVFGGARFLLEFPRSYQLGENDAPGTESEDEPMDAAPVKNDIDSGQIKARLFIVEDDPDLLQLLLAVLGTEFDCAAFDNAKDALEALTRKDRPALIISDILMPLMDGLTFLERSRAIQPNLTFVFITASDSEQVRKDALALGAIDCIKKPFVPEELSRRIRNLLDREKTITETLKRRIAREIDSAFGQQSPGVPPDPPAVQRKDALKEAGLSVRERQVADLILDGKSDKEISFELGITMATVSTHTQHVYRKSGVRGRSELLVLVHKAATGRS